MNKLFRKHPGLDYGSVFGIKEHLGEKGATQRKCFRFLTNHCPISLKTFISRNWNLSAFAFEVSNPRTPTEILEGLMQILPLMKWS